METEVVDEFSSAMPFPLHLEKTKPSLDVAVTLASVPSEKEPSPVSVPDSFGLLCSVSECVAGAKVAVMVWEELTVTEVELAEGSATFEPIQPEKTYPAAGMAEIVVFCP